MKFGICCSLDEAPAALDGGFDYVELPANTLLGNEDRYRQWACEATNLFFPGWVKLFGTDATPYDQYAQDVVLAARDLGVSVMVIGSGNARRAPEGLSIAKAEKDFVRIAASLSDLGRYNNVTIAPESLNHTETNVGNDLGSFALALKEREVAYTADSYHVLVEWAANHPKAQAPPADYWAEQLPHAPAHVHIADLPRNAPTPGDPMLTGFVARLRALGYQHRVSLECRRSEGFDFKAARSNLQQLFEL